MKIREISVANYKCFFHIEGVELSPKSNVIIGENNAGKTALLELISLKYKNYPHRSEKTLPYPDASLKQASTTSMTVEVEFDELKKFIVDNHPEFIIQKKGDKTPDDMVNFISRDKLLITGTYSPTQFNDSTYYKDLGNYQSGIFTKMSWNRDDQSPEIINPTIRQNLRDIKHELISHMAEKIYFFKAERFNVGEYQIGKTTKLEPDASNLAQVLNYMQTSNKAKFERFLDHVKDIFPEIQDISIPPSSKSSQVEVKIWHIDPSTERDDLSFSLENSGTGIGQVLSILSVVINSEEPRPILIDEPQSFLHPGAIRKLFSILIQYFPQHQYIVSTHSPVVISAMNPEKIIRLEKSGIESQVFPVDKEDSEDMEKVLSSVGARLSDVFGADNILWVEGKTEELCFPIIVNDVLDKPLMGTIILGLVNTGDLEGKESRRVFKIYEKLSEGQSLLPQAVGFLLDREGKGKEEREDIERRSGGKAMFLDRRMFENYLLNPKAIAHVINSTNIKYSKEEVREKTPKEISSWIERNGGKDIYTANFSGNNLINNEKWIKTVHGANLLKDIFKQFTEFVPYDKKAHGLELTKWITENSPEYFDEIASQLDDFFQK